MEDEEKLEVLEEGRRTEEEERQEGRVGLANYSHYIKILGPVLSLAIGDLLSHSKCCPVLVYYLGEGTMVGCNLVLVAWTDRYNIFLTRL